MSNRLDKLVHWGHCRRVSRFDIFADLRHGIYVCVLTLNLTYTYSQRFPVYSGKDSTHKSRYIHLIERLWNMFYVSAVQVET